MSSFTDFCAVALGVVFEWSGVMKVASGTSWQVEGTPFSTGQPFIDRLVRRWLPLIEIVLGLMLIFRLATAVAGAASLILLVVFTASLGRVLASGQRPPCLCFGSSRARPVSWRSMVRNVVLIALAVTTVVAA